jgi:hypothetical protein
MRKITSLAVAALAVATLSFGGETRSWTQSSYPEFQKGNLKNLSIRSDGRLTLAPRKTEIYDSAAAYLWTLAQDSQGNIYTAGGPGAKLFRIPPNSKGEKIAEFDALEIHAIAVAPPAKDDSKDRVYVATAPDGKVWRVSANGKTEEFYDPKQKYIWAMLCDPAGNLYIATGDQGEVHKVTPEGKGSVFFKTDETHARSMALDREGNLIVGTDPGGLVVRVSAKGEGFVLYQMAKPEVTSLAIGPKNEIYAAAVGSKTASPVTAPAAGPTGLAAVPPGQRSGQVPLPPSAPASATVNITGGSEVYRFASGQAPEKIWTHAQDLAYALALDRDGRLLIGSGNKGNLYRVEGHSLYSTLLSLPVAQITALLPAKDGAVYAATGNVGKVFRAGPDNEPEGTIESDVFDTGGYSTWGRLTMSGDARGGTIALSARSGNVDRPQQNWSGWSKSTIGPTGGEIAAPPARFVQWEAILKASPGQPSPSVDSVEVAYLPQNVAPAINQIEITPPNYKFPDPVAPLNPSSPATLTLPAIGTTPERRPRVAAGAGIFPSMTYSKGAIGARWTASDENGDTLVYRVEIRGEKESSWKLLRDKVRERYVSFDSTAFPDGEYRLRVTASDSPSNTPENALTTQEESDPFTIDNTPPQITGLAVKGNAVQWHAEDARNLIHKMEYSLDGGEWTVVDPVSKLSDAQALDYSLTLPARTPGEHVIAVRATDDFDNVAVAKLVL